MISAVLLFSIMSLMNGQNLEINDYDLWVEYLAKGYRGIVLAGNDTQSLTFSAILTFSEYYNEGIMVSQRLNVYPTGRSYLATTYRSLPDFEILQELHENFIIGQTARLFVAAASAPEPPVYVTYESIKEAIQTGKKLESFVDLTCFERHAELAIGDSLLFPYWDTRIVNEGTADEYIEVVWYHISIYTDGGVLLGFGYFNVVDNHAGYDEYLCTLGAHWTLREVAGFPDGGRQITTFEEMKVRLLSGLPTDMVLDNTQCQVQGDDDIMDTNTFIQRRAIKNWQLFAETPGRTGESIHLDYFQFGGDVDPYILHQNIDIDVNRALVHISLINMEPNFRQLQSWFASAWMESKVEGERTQLTSVADVVEAASSGYTMAVSISLDNCTDENGDPGENSIVGTSADYSHARDDVVYAINDFTMRLKPGTLDGFAFDRAALTSGQHSPVSTQLRFQDPFPNFTRFPSGVGFEFPATQHESSV
ncbi:unnamed protein product [Cyprideis torosa]|uniref:Uncharacterized protein n=1 Tax=Cyprideis torosa TaxID=163714 RepID=A0A7R8ZL53_9CRUS|nr:unnamed protein product [Cyprideis torosa]CAG0885872.1 unnamed protein product [Cyprideis torosa]